MMKRRVAVIAVACALLVAGAAVAQQVRGLGRVTGQVVDDTGAPVIGATVRADLLGVGGTTTTTNDKGEWTISGIAKGEWVITVAKDGLAIQKQSALVKEMAAPPFVKTTLRKQ